FQAEDGIRDFHVTGVQTCALPISTDGTCPPRSRAASRAGCGVYARCAGASSCARPPSARSPDSARHGLAQDRAPPRRLDAPEVAQVDLMMLARRAQPLGRQVLGVDALEDRSLVVEAPDVQGLEDRKSTRL